MLLRKSPRSARPAAPADQSARLEHERLASLINSMADGVIAVDKQTRVVIYNGAALNLLDRNDPVEGKLLGDIFHPVSKTGKPVDIVRLVRATAAPTTSRDLRLQYRDGSIISLYLSLAPVRLGYGSMGKQGYVLVLRDITREKSLEEERDEFISVASHELRTPIAITEGNISNAQFIVEKTGDLGKVKLALEQAHNQILFLADLVNDLSTLSRAERGTLPLDIEPIAVRELLAELAHDYEQEAAKQHLALRIEATATHPLRSSRLYVREMLQNFITNALKYTEHGTVTIRAQDQPGGVRFAVADTGIGISHSDQKRVFDKFFRSEDYRTRKTSGTGLGLYVAAKLARLLHADITLESKLNSGSTFGIFVPDFSQSDGSKPVR